MLAPFSGTTRWKRTWKPPAEEAFSFPVPLHPLTEGVRVLELFHGPTAAFKEFGAVSGLVHDGWRARKGNA